MIREKEYAGVIDIRLTERRVRSQEDTLGVAEFLERYLRQARMHLNLINSGNNFAVWEKNLESLDREVGDSEGANFA